MLRFIFTILTISFCICKTWTGGASSTEWNDPSNWNPLGAPTASDDVVLNSANVLVSQLGGAVAHSVLASGSTSLVVRGSSLTIGQGGLKLVDSSILEVDAGNGSVSVTNGTAIIASVGGVQHLSGDLAGNWVIKQGSSLSLNRSPIVIKGTLTNEGSVVSTVGRNGLTAPLFNNTKSGTVVFVGDGSLFIDNLVNDGSITLAQETLFNSNFQNNGLLSIPGASVFNRVSYKGNGVLALNDTLTLSVVNGAFGTVNLLNKAVRISGQEVVASVNTLNAVHKGDTIKLYTGVDTSTCTSPCGPFASNTYQSLLVWLA